MKQELNIISNAPAKIFFKLTVTGSFLLAFAYVAIVLLNKAIQ